jgi:hypothetical protein
MADPQSHRPLQETEVAPPQAETDTPEPEAEPTPGLLGPRLKETRVRLGALIAVAVAVGFIIWAAVGGSGGSSPSVPPAQTTKGTGPIALSYGGLRTLARAVGQPIYWIGTKPGVLYELRRTADRKVYIRYLPAGVRGGDHRAFLTVGTYPLKDAFSVTQKLAQGSGPTQLHPPRGAVGFYGKGSTTNAYIAFPGSDYQIEVYSPTPGEARGLVDGGAVTKIAAGAPVSTKATAVTPGELGNTARTLGQPIYWAGRQSGVTYELRQEASGRIYVRYLPSGVKVGASGTYLTVATYPVAGAFAVTEGLGKEPGNTKRTLKGGAIAAYARSPNTTSVYVAFPGADYQIEVFDPSPGAALRVVTSGRIAAVG